jgi:hypothetical protein
LSSRSRSSSVSWLAGMPVMRETTPAISCGPTVGTAPPPSSTVDIRLRSSAISSRSCDAFSYFSSATA